MTRWLVTGAGGMLGTDAADIVLFYTNLNAVRISLRVFMTGQVKEFTIERKIAWVENALAIWRPTAPPFGSHQGLRSTEKRGHPRLRPMDAGKTRRWE